MFVLNTKIISYKYLQLHQIVTYIQLHILLLISQVTSVKSLTTELQIQKYLIHKPVTFLSYSNNKAPIQSIRDRRNRTSKAVCPNLPKVDLQAIQLTVLPFIL